MLVIIAILVAILVPVTSSARRSAQIQDSVQHLRQLYLNLQTYRADADGSDTTFESYYTLGLPPAQLERGPIYLQNSALLKSPCGAIRSAFETSGYSLQLGHIDPVFVLFDPLLGPQQPKEFREHLATHRENSVMFTDVNCNSPDTNLADPYSTKRGVAVLFSGRLVNKVGRGTASALGWYSAP